MPDKNPTSNVRAPDWGTGINYKKYDIRYHQKSLIDTNASVLPLTDGWQRYASGSHMPHVLTANIARSGFGEERPTQLPLQLEISSASNGTYSAFADSDGDFGELKANFIGIRYLQLRNPNYAGFEDDVYRTKMQFKLVFGKGKEVNSKTRLKKTAKLVITYQQEDYPAPNSSYTIEKDLSGFLTF